MAELRLDGVSRVHDDGTRAVDRLTLHVADREVVTLLGPSGSGKTTVLRVVAGLEPLAEGTIRIGGRVVNDVRPAARDLAMVFEDHALYPFLSVADNLSFGLRVRGTPEPEVQRRVAAEARSLGLMPLMGRAPRLLSAGERQSAGLARAMVRVPKVFLLDEPLTHLDAPQRDRRRGELAQMLRGLGVTALYVTHDQSEAMAIGDRVAVLADGRLQQVDTPEAVYGRPSNAFVASFVGTAGLVRAEVGPLGLRVGSQELRWPGTGPEPLRHLTGRELLVCIRPEHVGVAEPASRARLRVVVRRAEHHGNVILATCEVEGSGRRTLVARLPPPVRTGDALELAVHVGRLHLFDPATGDALWHGA